MSGGEIAVVPMGILLAPVALVAVGAGVAATMAIRAAQAGTEATGRALEQFADEMERSANAQDDLAIRTRLWELAAGSVARTNQDLRLLAARAEKSGVRLALPRPIDLTGRKLADTRDLVAQAQVSLAGLRAAVEQAEAVRERRTLLVELSALADSAPSAAEVLARHQTVLASRNQSRGTVSAKTHKVDERRVHAEIDAILCQLHEDASADDRAEALTAAARAEQQKSTSMSRTYLDALARTVRKDINPRIARRREAANLLAALEQPLVADVITDAAPPRPPCFDSIERLRAVVRGDADLVDDDRRDAHSALNFAQVEINRRRLLDGVAEAFSGLGYSVTAGLQVHHSATLSVSRQAWRGGHSADVWIDEAGRVRSRLIRLAPEADGEAGRCADLNDSLRHVGAELNRHGIGAKVHLPSEPVPALMRFAPGTGSTTLSSFDDSAHSARTQDHPEENR
ncbi:hypothetical protein ACIBD9_04030 [Micromonospora sp. NPDC050784]|uniref:hypothetical protein n=1 Tax=Micromonospora sp. NPDC050784 TaxID=3364281 RepID=UPI003790CEAD